LRYVLAALLSLILMVAVRVAAQGPPVPPPGGQSPPVQTGRGAGGQGGRGFPAQQRPLADPAVIARGKTLYEINCRACHGADLRGGDMAGPNLLRSQIALNDNDGEAIGEIVRTGRGAMDPFDLPVDSVKAIAAYVRSILATARGQGSPPAGPRVELNVLVGNAAAGQAFFTTHCSSCHSPTGDLSGIAQRVPDPMALQNLWVSGGGSGGRGGGRGGRAGGAGAAADGPNRREVTVTVTLASGEKVEGRLGRIDDFIVTLTLPDGTMRSFRRDGDLPRIDIRDPLDAHKKLLLVYTNADMHNVTAFLATLK
jgi:cytochrome c oxidase cbb3-type subunit III